MLLVATSDFVPLCLGIPKNAGVTSHFRPLLGPREGKGEAANFDFVPLCLWTPGMQGSHSISALFWAPEKVGLRHPTLILSPFVWGAPRMQG